MVKIMDALKRFVEFYYSLGPRLPKRPKNAPSDQEMGPNSEDDAENDAEDEINNLQTSSPRCRKNYCSYLHHLRASRPIVLLKTAQKTSIRFTIIFLATAFFIAAVTAVSKASMAEMFIAGATYSAVLVEFVASNGPSDISGNTGGSSAFPTAR